MAYRHGIDGPWGQVRYTLRQLEIFIDAASDCNFARAAERLGISQPAVSDHVRALERRLGSELFVRRRGSTARLTAAGERLKLEAPAVLEQSARLGDQALAAGRTVTLRVFAGPQIVDGVLRAALPAFHRAHPEIALKISSELSGEAVQEMIHRSQLDIAVFTAPSGNLPSEAEVLGEVPCVVAASRRLVGERQLTPADIGALPFVLPLEGAPATRWVERALAELGVVPSNIAARTQYLDVQQKIVEAGAAAGLLFREAVEASPVRQELRLLSREASGLRRALLVRKGDARPEVQTVAAFLRATIGHPAAQGG